MIRKVQMIMLECDNCKEPFKQDDRTVFADAEQTIEEALEQGWEIDCNTDKKHYCDDCANRKFQND